MRKKLKKMFFLGASVAKKGLSAVHKKRIKAVVKEFVKDGKLAIKEGKILVKELIKDSKKLKTALKAKVKRRVKSFKKARK